MTVYYDPYDVGIVHDPYPTYATLRDEASEHLVRCASAGHPDIAADMVPPLNPGAM